MLTSNQTNFSTESAQGMTINFNSGTNGSFQFGNKAAYGLQLRLTGLQQNSSLQAFANNTMFFSAPLQVFGVSNNFASSFSWSSTGNGNGSFTLLFFQ